MKRAQVPYLPPEGGEVQLPAAIARHFHVLRVVVGEAVELFDGHGAFAQAEVLELGPDGGRCCAAPSQTSQSATPALGLMQVLPKGAKIDGMVRMTTEIGITCMHVVHNRYSVALPDRKAFTKRQQRLTKIAQEAARQSGRCETPVISGFDDLLTAAAQIPRWKPRLLIWEKSDQPITTALTRAIAQSSKVDRGKPAGEAIGRPTGKPAQNQPAGPAGQVHDHTTPNRSLRPHIELWVLVGAEGGIGDDEASKLLDLGFQHASLGPYILRVETAAPVACALALESWRQNTQGQT